jgi:hypothetical protein
MARRRAVEAEIYRRRSDAEVRLRPLWGVVGNRALRCEVFKVPVRRGLLFHTRWSVGIRPLIMCSGTLRSVMTVEHDGHRKLLAEAPGD